MARLLETQIDDNVRSALGEGGYYTQGFGGSTLGEYQSWYTGQFGLDPFGTAANLSGGGVPGSVDDPAAWLRRNPLRFSPETGTITGPVPTDPRAIARRGIVEEQFAQAQEKRERRMGLGMMNWLMGLSTQLGGSDFQKIAPIGMAAAQTRTSYNAPVTDYSGLLGVLGMEQMQREREEASQFDFTRDLLPSLISLGGTIGGAVAARG